jgi:hypothetical protein
MELCITVNRRTDMNRKLLLLTVNETKYLAIGCKFAEYDLRVGRLDGLLAHGKLAQ